MKRKSVLFLSSLLAVHLIANSTLTVHAEWQQSNDGRWWNTNTSSLGFSTGWELINNNWYYFDSEGWMQTGWVQNDGIWYYCDSDGSMATGWIHDKDTWYYCNATGAMQSNQWIGDYYVTENGEMATNTWIGEFYVGTDGRWIPGYGQAAEGWVKDSNGWWYQRADGSYPVNTWEYINGFWYYFYDSGYMANNTRIDGTYYVGDDGAWIVDDMKEILPSGLYVNTEKGEPIYLALSIYTERAFSDYAIGDEVGVATIKMGEAGQEYGYNKLTKTDINTYQYKYNNCTIKVYEDSLIVLDGDLKGTYQKLRAFYS